jgi:pimeloyl-ACP methyl ester carboxylesterase
MTEEEVLITNSGAPAIHADLRTVSAETALPVIVLSHGFMGYRRWGWFPWLSSELAAAGFHTVTFSFSMNGCDNGSGRITRPGEFARNTVTREIEDLRRVVEYARYDLPFPVRDRLVGLFGHSRGGAVSIIYGSFDHKIGSLVTWSTPSRLDRYTERRKRLWKKTGKLTFRGGRSGQPLHLDYSYYRDIERNGEKYDLPLRMEKVRAPHLIVHGERDAAVSLREARRLVSRTGTGRVRFDVLPGSGHTFGVKDPMSGPPPRALSLAGKRTAEWFLDTLSKN